MKNQNRYQKFHEPLIDITMNNELKNKFLTIFPNLLNSFPAEPNYVKESRLKAIDALAAVPFPSSKDESWKYSLIQPLLVNTYSLPGNNFPSVKTSPPPVIHPGHFPDGALINGYYCIDGIGAGTENNFMLKSLSVAAGKNDGMLTSSFSVNGNADHSFFSHLNTAFWQDGIYIEIPCGKKTTKPVEINIISQGERILSQPRIFINSAKNSHAEIHIYFYGSDEGNSFTNLVQNIHLDENAFLNLVLFRSKDDNDILLNSTEVQQETGSHFISHIITLNGKWTRNVINVSLLGKESRAELFGLYTPSGDQFTDNRTRIEHRAPNASSNEFYKGVMDGKSTAIFNGKIFVGRDAQKTNAFQSNKNLLLSDRAVVFSKPELQIYADDVKCTHGSATGSLDEDALFYLRSRGMKYETAKKILVQAFAGDIVAGVGSESLKNEILSLIAGKFNS
ncbi:MAG: Fe-S cluster assembly protein SufD [Bacteroidetes bacterium]|nr:Fe-S cluster assembly protein SufD [Bacteroidota bacterium]